MNHSNISKPPLSDLIAPERKNLDQTRKYLFEQREQFDTLLTSARKLSRQCAARHVNDPKQIYGAKLFTRICTSGHSLLWNTPGNRFSNGKEEPFDSAATSAIARSIAECSITFHYLCIMEMDADEWQLRWNIMNLHDCQSRIKLFRDLDPHDSSIRGFTKQFNELINRIKLNSTFMKLPEESKKILLKGERPFIIGKSEIVDSMNLDKARFKALYGLFSAQLHASPMAFYRMNALEGRGTGVENNVDNGYIAMSLEFAGQFLNKTTIEMRNLFEEIYQKPGGLFEI